MRFSDSPWRWTPWPKEQHEETIEALRTYYADRGEPLPLRVIEADIVYLADQAQHPTTPRAFPGRPTLRERWNITDWGVRRALQSEGWKHILALLGMSEPRPADHAPPAVRQPAASRPPAGGRANLDNGAESASAPPALRQRLSTRAEIDPRSQIPDPSRIHVRVDPATGFRVITDPGSRARRRADPAPSTTAAPRGIAHAAIPQLPLIGDDYAEETTVARPEPGAPEPRRARRRRSTSTSSEPHPRFSEILELWNDTAVDALEQRSPEGTQWVRHTRTRHTSGGLGKRLNQLLHDGRADDVRLLIEWYAHAPHDDRVKAQWWRDRGIDLVALLRDQTFDGLVECAVAWDAHGRPQTLERQRKPAVVYDDGGAAARLAAFRAEQAAKAGGGSHGA